MTSAAEKWRSGGAAGGGQRPTRGLGPGPDTLTQLRLQSRALAGEGGVSTRRELGGGVPLLCELSASPSSRIQGRMQVRGRHCGKRNREQKSQPRPKARQCPGASSERSRPARTRAPVTLPDAPAEARALMAGSRRVSDPSGKTEAVTPRHGQPSRAVTLLCGSIGGKFYKQGDC